MSQNPRYVIGVRAVLGGLPPLESGWVGRTREELGAWVAQRRHQQATPDWRECAFDPAIAATLSLAELRRAYRWRKGRR